ncbi:MAG: sugar phosphate nucleotidyltransferase [Victivallaceae bacterium]|jgi:mannose-1-phosphate guanylyltransferase|nr:sugar phosphate nucleotidyltransferase [Victivallaceae bacterium]NLK84154.1 mannose-1-phosphate guanylyltransferase [Lentisphaerota bacterium]MDD3117206.1 sugar phosphate nucleotidyltransferase [Victivallaceae bacterium]MDD3703728.1 sugar phosphate nucleotidyltransferase [Victivallaceae bacterium]MDD4317805.1 sugar phosphate nucleotidyltransferase [Victivallaceae bacterium]
MNNNNLYAVVMAGGRGERFWPQSRASRPKQLLRLIGNLTLIEQTVERLNPLVKNENILILTNADYVAPMRSLLNQIPPQNIIGEPFGKDTGPCVAAAAGLVKSLSGGDENSVMIMLPSDHIIRDNSALRQVLGDSAAAVQSGKIATIGITPDYASTGYGYIKCGEKLDISGETVFRQSLGFKEKPNAENAEHMLAEGNYQWNSGMFVWTVKTITDAFLKYAPELAEIAEAVSHGNDNGRFIEAMTEQYEKCDKISIDYAVMEKLPSEDVIVAESTFDWDDVGSWNALRNQIKPDENNNVVRGLFEGVNVSDSIIVSDSRHLITAVDVSDLIIVHTDDATLICQSKSAQRIKELVGKISQNPALEKFL